jgi:cellulose biosynthesis protein BcsQ
MPFTPDPKALEGLETTTEVVNDIVAAELAQTKVLGLVQIAYDRRLAVTDDAREQVRAAYGEMLFDATIRTNTNFIVCPAWHRDIFEIEKTAKVRRGVEDFRTLAAEVVGRLSIGSPSRAIA